MKRANPSRREVLSALAATGAATLVDLGPVLARLAAQQPCADPATAGTLLGTLPLFRTGWPVQPFGVKFGGAGLDARLVTDLSLLQSDRPITPNALAFIRTECPRAAAAHQGPWTIRTSGIEADALGKGGDVRHGTLALDELTRDARSMGPHLCECSGNNNPANFGLMSVAEWDGVPLTDVVSRLPPSVTSHGCTGGRRRSRRTTICSLHPGCELDLSAFGARPARRIHRGPYERRADPARSREAATACRAWVVWMRVDQMGERDSPGRPRRARHQPDERVRGANSSDPPARPRQGLRGTRDPDRSNPNSRREATRPGWPRVPHRRHRLGRCETCGSPRDPFWYSGWVETVFHLSHAPDSGALGAVGIPLEARNHRTLQHFTPSPRYLGPPTPARQWPLHAAGQDR